MFFLLATFLTLRTISCTTTGKNLYIPPFPTSEKSKYGQPRSVSGQCYTLVCKCAVTASIAAMSPIMVSKGHTKPSPGSQQGILSQAVTQHQQHSKLSLLLRGWDADRPPSPGRLASCHLSSGELRAFRNSQLL